MRSTGPGSTRPVSTSPGSASPGREAGTEPVHRLTGAPAGEPSEPSAAASRSASRVGAAPAAAAHPSPNMLPRARAAACLERTFVRMIATGGIVGIGVAIAAIMASSNSPVG